MSGERIREVAARTPLRVRLVAVLLALMTAALLVTGFAASAILSHYLNGRVDDQLQSAFGPAIDRLLRNPSVGDTGPGGYVTPSPYYVQASAPNGAVVARVTPSHTRGNLLPALPRLTLQQAFSHHGDPYTVGSQHGGEQWRAVTTVLADRSGSITVAVSLSDVQATLARLRWVEVLVGVAVLAVLGGAGYAAVRSSLRPLTQMESTATAIAAGDLTLRAPNRDPRTEVGRLSLAFNSMLGQIEAAFRSRVASERSARASEERIRQFVADASHELRTPLTSIRGYAELERTRLEADDGDLADVLHRIEQEATRIGLLVDDLMLLARLDQQRPIRRDPVDLLALAADLVRSSRVLNPGRSIDLEVADDGAAPIVLGDEARLRQVMTNLLNNAVTHTPPGTPVDLRIGTELVDGRGWAVLQVADKGLGLDAEQAARVFERFYRTDPSRSREHGGSGLGLSIVQAIVAAHDGTVQLDTAPGAGATFRVRLPLADERAGRTGAR